MVTVLVFIGTAALVFWWCIHDQLGLEKRLGFSKQPCTTDAEFCALMPDIPDDIALKVRGALADAASWDREEIHPNTRLVEFELW